MRLSVAILAFNSADYIEPLLQGWARFLKPGGTIALHNSNDRVYAHDHDGHRRVAVEEVNPPTTTARCSLEPPPSG